ncbi:putative cyclin [Trypanosoma grayi]|uniref:putative cyclin n=1 Tax=Trypanosoma grayi TaxID=71804 RepID=UPI0004F47397|nr:putative cyclin [Trypanosoma grayi]KEG12071.1 putative cyclin [Trypanosoma grayi]
MAERHVLSDHTNRPLLTRKSLPPLVSPLHTGNKGSVVECSKGVDAIHHFHQTDVNCSPVYVPEYSSEIGDYFLVSERNHYRDSNYMANQSEITEKMRMILVDWLVDVVTKFRLHAETYYLAVDIVDRYLGAKGIGRARLQLVGITAILLSAKHEEIWPPGIKDCVFICANTYSAQEVFEMERDIAVTLRFKLTVPTTYPLACRFLECGDSEPIIRDATFFFLECAAHSYEMLQHLPSRVAAASVLLGRLLVVWNSCIDRSGIVPSKLWGRDMMRAGRGITLDEILSVAEKLLNFTRSFSTPLSKLQATRRKYLSQKYNSVASLDLPTLSLIFFFR